MVAAGTHDGSAFEDVKTSNDSFARLQRDEDLLRVVSGRSRVSSKHELRRGGRPSFMMRGGTNFDGGLGVDVEGPAGEEHMDLR